MSDLIDPTTTLRRRRQALAKQVALLSIENKIEEAKNELERQTLLQIIEAIQTQLAGARQDLADRTERIESLLQAQGIEGRLKAELELIVQAQKVEI